MILNIGANSAKLRSFANEILAECDRVEARPHPETGTPAQNLEVTMYAHQNGAGGREVTLSFNNDDMEGRDDIDPDLILVDFDD